MMSFVSFITKTVSTIFLTSVLFYDCHCSPSMNLYVEQSFIYNTIFRAHRNFKKQTKKSVNCTKHLGSGT